MILLREDITQIICNVPVATNLTSNIKGRQFAPNTKFLIFQNCLIFLSSVTNWWGWISSTRLYTSNYSTCWSNFMRNNRKFRARGL